MRYELQTFNAAFLANNIIQDPVQKAYWRGVADTSMQHAKDLEALEDVANAQKLTPKTINKQIK